MTTESQSALLHFTTDAFGPGEKKAACCEVYGRTIAKVDLEPPEGDGFKIEAALRNLPGLRLISVMGTELRFRKPASLLDDDDDVALLIVDSGYWAGAQFGRTVRLEAGEAVLCANAELGTGLSFGRRVMLRVPNKTIATAIADPGARFLRRIPRDTEGLRLLRRYLHAMQDMDLATADLQRLTVAHIHDLMAVALGATGDAASAAAERGVRAARLRAVKDDIARNLAEGDISVAATAARQRVSPRYLRKLFESEGVSFSEYVLDQRLAFAHRLLSDPRRANEKIASVAFTAGFGDVSYFYRVFRRRYDLLPSDVRAQARCLH